jgi:hypothetical protein
MWAIVGRFRADDGSDDEALARTARALAEGAEQIPGHVTTRLFASPDRIHLLCTTTWEIESSARTYLKIIEEQRERLKAGYNAADAEFLFLEEIAEHGAAAS